MKNGTHTNYEIRSSIIILLLKIVWVQIIMTLSHVLLSNVMSHKIHDAAVWIFSGQTWELFIFHTIVTIVIIYMILKRLTTYYSLHESELVCKDWIISNSKYITKLDQNTDLTYHQSWFQRMCWYWDIELTNQFTHHKTLLKNIPNTEYYVDMIRNQCYASTKTQDAETIKANAF